MKKFVLVIFVFFLSACAKNNSEYLSEKIPDISHNNTKISENFSEKNSINKHEECFRTSPLLQNDYPKYFWSFENDFDGKCWYVGLVSENFFLINADDFLVAYATGETLQETEWKVGEWKDFDGTYGNKLWGKVGGYTGMTDYVNQNFWYSWHEMPNFANFVDIMELF